MGADKIERINSGPDDFWVVAATDKTKEIEGVWCESFGREFRIARMGGRNMLKLQMRQKRNIEKLNIDIETIDSHKLHDVNVQTFVDVCLLDWRNMNDLDGAPLPFSKENALFVMNRCPDVFDELQGVAMASDNYTDEQVRATAKK